MSDLSCCPVLKSTYEVPEECSEEIVGAAVAGIFEALPVFEVHSGSGRANEAPETALTQHETSHQFMQIDAFHVF